MLSSWLDFQLPASWLLACECLDIDLSVKSASCEHLKMSQNRRYATCALQIVWNDHKVAQSWPKYHIKRRDHVLEVHPSRLKQSITLHIINNFIHSRFTSKIHDWNSINIVLWESHGMKLLSVQKLWSCLRNVLLEVKRNALLHKSFITSSIYDLLQKFMTRVASIIHPEKDT